MYSLDVNLVLGRLVEIVLMFLVCHAVFDDSFLMLCSRNGIGTCTNLCGCLM